MHAEDCQQQVKSEKDQPECNFCIEIGKSNLLMTDRFKRQGQNDQNQEIDMCC